MKKSNLFNNLVILISTMLWGYILIDIAIKIVKLYF